MEKEGKKVDYTPDFGVIDSTPVSYMALINVPKKDAYVEPSGESYVNSLNLVNYTVKDNKDDCRKE